MFRYLNILFPVFLAAATVLCTGCNTATEEDTQDYCYINGLTIGSLRRTVTKRIDHETTITTTSIVYTTGWPFTVDQIKNEIYNRDPLPTGCSRRTLLDISYKGKSLLYRPHSTGSAISWIAYNSSDSIDIPEDGGVDFLVNGADGSMRVYNLQLNIHDQEPDDWSWENKSEGLNMSDWTEARMASVGEYVLLYGKTPTGWKLWRSADGGAWESLVISGLPPTAAVASIISDDERLYTNDADGNVWQSEDGATWTEQGIVGVKRLVGVSDKRLYYIHDGGLRSIALEEEEAEWEDEVLDATPASMSSFNDIDSVRCLFSETSNYLKRILMVGSLKAPAEEDITAPEWCKMWSAAADEARREWNYYAPSWVNKYGLPAMKPLGVQRSGNLLVAFGGERTQTSAIAPFNLLYISEDNGLTWRTDGLFYLPDELWGKNCNWLSSTSDADDYVWIVARVNDTETYVVRGRENDLGFEY